MPIQVRKGGVWNQLVSGEVFANAAWHSLVAVKVYANGAWRLVANFTPPSPPPPSGGGGGGTGGGGTMTLTASPATQTIRDSGTTQATTVTATPSGGLAPYTYVWSFDSHDSGISIVTPTRAVTDVSVSGLTVFTSQ